MDDAAALLAVNVMGVDDLFPPDFLVVSLAVSAFDDFLHPFLSRLLS